MASRSAAAALRRDELADLRQVVETLVVRVELLEAARPRDVEDGRLRKLLAVSTKGLPFKACELLDYAAQLDDPALRRGLQAATLQTSQEIGAWLRDRVGTASGITITRVRGRRWICTCDT